MRRIVQNHERLNLEHPGKHVSQQYQYFPKNSEVDVRMKSLQARWRGITEVVSIAALLHDLGHVPFGHTLEDEFTGIFQRHDRMAGHRLYEMLFNQESELAEIFSNGKRWLPEIENGDLREIIFLILNWKEKIVPPESFQDILKGHIREIKERGEKDGELQRLTHLDAWHKKYTRGDIPLFQPYMTDIIGNTICADILDYLPRDRTNLGMEVRKHDRLQRYFTIRRGTVHPDEDYRMSIMVTRKGRGGQRRDVATAVLDVMRERFEMAEGVYYHHKKAAASSMLAKLAEIAGVVESDYQARGQKKTLKPRDDSAVYPAPWNPKPIPEGPPHMTHLSDAELIDYLGTGVQVDLADKETELHYRQLQQRLYRGLRYRRRDLYRTLLVIDTDLAEESIHHVAYFTKVLRGHGDHPDNTGRQEFEVTLAKAAGMKDGDVLIYCPAGDMQSKEIDARLEIQENKVLPLRVQDTFVYKRDVDTLQEYYKSLWRAYVFVAPHLFADSVRCKAVVDAFCEHFQIDPAEAYQKVRGHSFSAVPNTSPAISMTQRPDVTSATDTTRLHRLLEPVLAEESEKALLLDSLRTFVQTTLASAGPEQRTHFWDELPAFVTQRTPKKKFLLNRLTVAQLIEQLTSFLLAQGDEIAAEDT